MRQPPFLKDILKIAIPVSLESVGQLLLGFIDQVMVATLGAIAVAAVGLANSITFVFIMALAGLANASAVLSARAFGAGNHNLLSQLVNVGLLLGLVFSGIVMVPLWTFSTEILQLGSNDPELTRTADGFLKIMLLALPLMVTGALCTGVLRSLSKAKVPLHATLFSMVINTVLAYLFVFTFGWGVQGAAWATFTAQLFKAVYLLIQLYQHPSVHWISITPGRIQQTAKELLPLSVPMMATATLWAFSLFLYNVLLGKMGTQAIAAYQIIRSMEGLFVVWSAGLAAAATTLVGQALGQNNIPLAQNRVRSIQKTGLLTGAITGVLFFGASYLLPVFYPKVGDAVLHLAFIGMVMNSFFQAVKVQNMIHGSAVLPSTGDPRGVLMGDVVSAYLVGLPLAAVFGLWMGWGLPGVLGAHLFSELIKLAIFYGRYRRVNWKVLEAA